MKSNPHTFPHLLRTLPELSNVQRVHLGWTQDLGLSATREASLLVTEFSWYR